jgi:hypothetical protein
MLYAGYAGKTGQHRLRWPAAERLQKGSGSFENRCLLQPSLYFQFSNLGAFETAPYATAL